MTVQSIQEILTDLLIHADRRLPLTLSAQGVRSLVHYVSHVSSTDDGKWTIEERTKLMQEVDTRAKLEASLLPSEG